MALHPVPFDPMPRSRFDQFLPELGVLDGLLVRGSPAVALPIVDPAGDSIPDVDAISVKLHAARPFQRFKAANRGEKLHAVVGRKRLAARDLSLFLAHAQERGPAAGPWVSPARAVRENLDERKFGQATSSRGSLNVMRSGE